MWFVVRCHIIWTRLVWSSTSNICYHWPTSRWTMWSRLWNLICARVLSWMCSYVFSNYLYTKTQTKYYCSLTVERRKRRPKFPFPAFSFNLSTEKGRLGPWCPRVCHRLVLFVLLLLFTPFGRIASRLFFVLYFSSRLVSLAIFPLRLAQSQTG